MDLREIRRGELKSAAILGLRSTKDVVVLEDPRFPDSMTMEWDPQDIASMLSRTYAPSVVGMDRSDEGSTTSSSSAIDIDVLITFDPQGISSHANHISLYYGALHWLRQIDPAGATVALYTLTTINIVRKYISLFDSAFSILSAASQKSGGHLRGHYPDHLLFLSGVSGYRRAQKAMTKGHVSQMLWFRWGWIGLSRYVSVNDLKREHAAASSH